MLFILVIFVIIFIIFCIRGKELLKNKIDEIIYNKFSKKKKNENKGNNSKMTKNENISKKDQNIRKKIQRKRKNRT